MKLRNLLTVVILFFAATTWAQSSGAVNWKPAGSNQQVSLQIAQGSCNGKEVVLLRLENLNTFNVDVTVTLWGSVQKKISLKAGQKVVGGCAATLDNYTATVPAGKTNGDVPVSITVRAGK